MGLPPELVEQLQSSKPQGFEVWPINKLIVVTWLVIASQWQTVPLADGRVHWLGLNYSAVRDGLELAQVAISPDTWAGIRVMEGAAASALNGTRG